MAMPMVKENLPLVEKALCDKLQSAELRDGESYAAYVVTCVEGRAMLSFCAFSENDTCLRSISTQTASDEIIKLINNL